MLKARIIPCLDVNAGRVVKGINFLNLVDAGDPVSQAKYYNDQGADELCFLDITASSDDREIIYSVIEQVAQECRIPITVGGGIRTIDDIRKLFRFGADKVSINSAAISNPSLIQEAVEIFGSQSIIVAIDSKNVNGEYKVFSHGGRKDTNLKTLEWVQEVEKLGAGEILLTSMDADGTKSGYDIDLYNAVSKLTSIPIIASGGVGKDKDFLDVYQAGVYGMLAASIFHFRNYTIAEIKNFLYRNNVPVRLDFQ